MKKAYFLSISLLLMSISTSLVSHDFNLLVKPCKSCDWIIYPEPFRLKESCEIARQGIFLNGMTKCEKITNL